MPTSDGEQSRKASLLVNAVSSWLGLGTNIVVGIVLTPIVIHRLGTVSYGTWSLIGSVVGYYGLLDLGISSAVTRFIALHKARGDMEAMNAVMRSALSLFLLSASVMLAIAVLAGNVFADFFGVPAGSRPAFHWSLIVLTLSTGTALVGQVFRAAIAAHEHYVLRNTLIVFTTLLRAAVALVALYSGYGMLGLAISYLAADVVALLANVYFCHRLRLGVDLRRARFSFPVLRELLRFGVGVFAISAAHTLRFGLDSAVIGRGIGLEAVGVFSIPSTLIRYFVSGLCTASSVLTPRLTALHARKETEDIRATTLRAMTAASVVTLLGAAVLILAGSAIIQTWVGPGFEAAPPLLTLLLVGVSLSLAQDPAVQLMFAMDRHHSIAAALLVEGALNLLLSVALVGRLGLTGVALGTTIPMIVNNLLVLPLYMSRALGVSRRDYYVRLLPWLAVATLALLQLVRGA